MKVLNELTRKKIFFILGLWLILCLLCIFSMPQFEGYDENFHYSMSLDNNSGGGRWIYSLFNFLGQKLQCTTNSMPLNPNFSYFSNLYSYDHKFSKIGYCNYYFRIIILLINFIIISIAIYFSKNKFRQKIFLLSIFFPSFLSFIAIFNIRNLGIILFFVSYLYGFFEKSFLKSLIICVLIYLITSDRSFIITFLGVTTTYAFLYYKKKSNQIYYNRKLFLVYIFLIIISSFFLKFDGIEDIYFNIQEMLFTNDAKVFNLFELFKGFIAIFAQFFYTSGQSSFLGIGLDYLIWFVALISIIRKKIFNYIFNLNSENLFSFKIEYFYSFYILSSFIIWYMMYLFNSFLKAGRYFFYIIPFFFALLLYQENKKLKFLNFDNILFLILILNLIYIIKNYIYLFLLE